MGCAQSAGRIGGLALAVGLGAATLVGGSPEAGAETESGPQTRATVADSRRPAVQGPPRQRTPVPKVPAAVSAAQASVARQSPARGDRERLARPDRSPAASVAAPAGAPVAAASAGGGPITVDSVETAFGRGVVKGVIHATSSRGLQLSYSLADAPDQGGQVSLDPAGAFTLVPRQTVAAAQAIEKFGVLIAERTPLEMFLAQLPFMGALVPQVFMALRRTPILGEALAPLIGSSTVQQISVDVGGLTAPPRPPMPVSAGAGWNLYSWQASSAPVLDAIDRQKPGLVRWFVEMDRFLEDETQPFWPSRTWSWDADTSFDPFFRTLAENNTTLVVALWNKDHWAKSMRACDTCNWPKIDQFAAFADDLDAEAEKFGVRVIIEPYNEPDLRWGSLGAATNIGATENFTGQWFIGLPQGYAKYTGGTGFVWQQMHQAIDAPLASGGIISLYTAEVALSDRLSGNYPTTNKSTRWIDATSPLVDYTSFHRYGLADGTAAEYVEWVYAEWSLWKSRKGFAVPFYIGEIGPTPLGAVGFTDAEAAVMREIHQALATDARFEGSYLGMTAHVFSNTGAPNPWETSTGWWDPEFTVTDR